VKQPRLWRLELPWDCRLPGSAAVYFKTRLFGLTPHDP
jgi:hypothetical protein